MGKTAPVPAPARLPAGVLPRPQALSKRATENTERTRKALPLARSARSDGEPPDEEDAPEPVPALDST